MQWAAFLLALVKGYRASQLAALTRHEAFTKLASDYSSLMVTLSPKFSGKNELADDLISPLKMPSCLEKGCPHPLCPV